MKKIKLVWIIVLVCTGFAAKAQWSITGTSPNQTARLNSANIIGLTLGDRKSDRIALWGALGSPGMYGFAIEDNTLYFKSNSAYRWYSNTNAGGTPKMTLTSEGRLGIGVDAPSSALHIKGELIVESSDNAGIRLNAGNEQSAVIGVQDDAGLGQGFFVHSNGAYRFMISPDGNVGIGTTKPTAKLQIAGNVAIGVFPTTYIYDPNYALTLNGNFKSKKVLVTNLPAAWPDYVFEKGHDLMSLNELNEYINKNSHLPEIPSADEVSKEGIDLAEMDVRLLKKIEELTLYLIKVNEKVDKLEQENLLLKSKE